MKLLLSILIYADHVKPTHEYEFYCYLECLLLDLLFEKFSLLVFTSHTDIQFLRMTRIDCIKVGRFPDTDLVYDVEYLPLVSQFDNIELMG